MPLLNLPTEIIIIVAKSIEHPGEHATLARTSRFLYEVAIPILYARNAKYKGSSALLRAAKMGMTETVKLCIKYGANLNACTEDHRTALIHAADNGHVEIAELLLADQATHISACDMTGDSATYLAARNNNPDMLETLLRHGADADQVHRDGMGLLHMPDLSSEIMRMLLQYGANPGQMDSAGNTPLSKAVKSRNFQHMVLLLICGAGSMIGPADLEDDPLAVALHRQDEDILRLLLSYGVHSSFAIHLRGATVLHMAIHLDRPRMLQVLLEEGLDPNLRERTGPTPLHFAAEKRNLETTRILLEHGANTQLIDNNNNTPHHIAASNRQILILQLLLVNDADPVVREYFSRTPVDEYDSPEAESVLLTKGPMGSRLVRLLRDASSAKRPQGHPVIFARRKGSRMKSSSLWCWT